MIVFPGHNVIFRHNNAMSTTTGIVRGWLEEAEEDFTIFPWPPNSSDLNPIKHVWENIDRVIRSMDSPPRFLQHLSTELQLA